MRTLERQSRSGVDQYSLNYITPIFAPTRSRFATKTEKQRYTDSVAATMGSPYYRDMDEPTSPAGGAHHRSRSASRPPISHTMDYPSKCLTAYAQHPTYPNPTHPSIHLPYGVQLNTYILLTIDWI